MKLTLTKQEVLLLQKLLYSYKENLPDDTTEKHSRFVGKLNKKIKRQVINQINKRKYLMEKNEILNSDCDVRRTAAGNPNTPVDVLTELAKDSDWYVRRTAAGNPNTPGYTPVRREFIVTPTYVAVQGTNNLWYKHHYPNVAPFYTCGCFCGSREQLLMRIYSLDNTGNAGERKMILDALDKKFEEVFGKVLIN